MVRDFTTIGKEGPVVPLSGLSGLFGPTDHALEQHTYLTLYPRPVFHAV